MSDRILEVRDLTKSYGAIMASRRLCLDIDRGEVHALIGPNGAGKTTAINQLSGDILPDSGSIVFDGVEISRMPPHRRARLGLARSFQITSIFDDLTVEENLALAIIAHAGHNFRFWRNCLKTPLVQRELPAALERVDLDRQAGTIARSLSHGEKRQLEVGMALTGRPKLLLLDEPMAGMGPGGTVEMAKLIGRLRGEITILLVEHDMDAVFALADRITVLVYGECVACGTVAEIRHHPTVRAAYLGED
ncbi:MAG: ABC transporter ATP-binding protein [Desulfoprunum sp.]|jgi:branched-chain amino acid transport system ATP-binding protein|uniref:ABC transporter ATP-binding protein n=1 Tax=Desulfoprunum sp. TaxID=2020866 RepID=UPI00052E2994|nr:branched-chain amino acid ABC transporter substrate-binding protein [Desulfobulbus sp. Tol-SR]